METIFRNSTLRSHSFEHEIRFEHKIKIGLQCFPRFKHVIDAQRNRVHNATNGSNVVCQQVTTKINGGFVIARYGMDENRIRANEVAFLQDLINNTAKLLS